MCALLGCRPMRRGEEGPIGPHFADLMKQAVAIAPFTNQNVVKVSVLSIWRLAIRGHPLSFVGALFPNARACRFEVSSFCRHLVCFMLHVRGWSGRCSDFSHRRGCCLLRLLAAGAAFQHSARPCREIRMISRRFFLQLERGVTSWRLAPALLIQITFKQPQG